VDNPKAIPAGSQAFGEPVIPLDEDLEVIGVEDGAAWLDAQARWEAFDPFSLAWDLLAPVVVSRFRSLRLHCQAALSAPIR